MPQTIEVISPNIETMEKPQILTAKNVQYYSSHTHELAHSQIHKASIFVELDLIQYDSNEKCYYCLPIPNYNSTTYKMIKHKIGWVCDCQACTKKINDNIYCPDIEEKIPCSHILALYYTWKINHWNEKHEQK